MQVLETYAPLVNLRFRLARGFRPVDPERIKKMKYNTDKKTERIYIKISPEKKERFKKLSSETGISMSALIDNAIENITPIILDKESFEDIRKLRIDINRIGNLIKKEDSDFLFVFKELKGNFTSDNLRSWKNQQRESRQELMEKMNEIISEIKKIERTINRGICESQSKKNDVSGT